MLRRWSCRTRTSSEACLRDIGTPRTRPRSPLRSRSWRTAASSLLILYLTTPLVGHPQCGTRVYLFGSALEGDGESDESSEDESGSRLERAKNFGSGVLSSIEKRVRPARAACEHAGHR